LLGWLGWAGLAGWAAGCLTLGITKGGGMLENGEGESKGTPPNKNRYPPSPHTKLLGFPKSLEFLV